MFFSYHVLIEDVHRGASPVVSPGIRNVIGVLAAYVPTVVKHKLSSPQKKALLFNLTKMSIFHWVCIFSQKGCQENRNHGISILSSF